MLRAEKGEWILKYLEAPPRREEPSVIYQAPEGAGIVPFPRQSSKCNSEDTGAAGLDMNLGPRLEAFSLPHLMTLVRRPKSAQLPQPGVLALAHYS